MKGYKILKGGPIELRVNGRVSNISTSKSKCVFNQLKPNNTIISNDLNICGRNIDLQIYIADEEGKNHIKFSGEVVNVRLIGEGNTFGKEEIENETNKIEITTTEIPGAHISGETVITVKGNSVSVSSIRGVFYN
uniref:Galectin n=1 Tax=Meloidogyne javanica TaxID=6303 RepID=A0A915MFN4_MELJA